jgi:hypothetical protein
MCPQHEDIVPAGWSLARTRELYLCRFEVLGPILLFQTHYMCVQEREREEWGMGRGGQGDEERQRKRG